MTEPDLDRILIGGREGGRVRLVPSQAEWPERFARERARIAAALGGTAELIEHVGSTAVPGLDAKPIVDILVAVADPGDPAARAALEARRLRAARRRGRGAPHVPHARSATSTSTCGSPAAPTSRATSSSATGCAPPTRTASPTRA